MEENIKTVNTNVDNAVVETMERLQTRIAELEATNKKLTHDIEIWEGLYNDEKEKQERLTKLTKALMAYVEVAL